MKVIQPEGNYFDKYQNKNKLIRLIMSNFFTNLDLLLDYIEFTLVYEAGCGEGFISQHIYHHRIDMQKMVKISASDLSETVIKRAILEYPHIRFHVRSIYHLKEKNDSYDLVIASEVLEHLEEPELAIEEIFRISRNYILISVPNEPIWRISNFLRGKYIKNFGNTPGHINHWSKKKIIELISQYGRIIEIRNPFPWTMILCQKR
jgi:SAM-dependent methyltransferase